MHFMTYKVYYYEESDRDEYGYFRGLTEKFKLIRTKSVDNAMKKFKEKYPSLFPVNAIPFPRGRLLTGGQYE